MGTTVFFRGLSWLLFLNLLIKPAWIFLIDRSVQNIVGHEVYGTYFALYNLTYVLSFIADAGLTNMLTQRLAAGEETNIRQLLWCKIVLTAVYAVACVAVAVATGVRQNTILGYLILIQSLFSLFVFLRSLLAARQLFKQDALFSVLDRSLLLLLCIGPVFGLFRPMTILLFLQLQTVSISFAVGSVLVFLLVKKQVTGGPPESIKNIGIWVAPFVLILLFISAHNRLDAFLLERLHRDGAKEAGIYAMAYRLLDAGNMLGYLTATFLVAFLARNKTNKSTIEKAVLLTRHALLFFSAIVLAFVAVFSSWVQEALYHLSDDYTKKVILLCLWCLPAYYVIHVYGSVLMAMAQFKPFILLVLLAFIVNVLLNLILVPSYGAVGCGMAALVSQYGCALLLWVMASRRLQLSYDLVTVLLYVVTAAVFGGLFFVGRLLTNNVLLILGSVIVGAFVLLLPLRKELKKTFLLLYE